MKKLLFALFAFPMLSMGQTAVTACATLSSAGTTYVLQNNISAAGKCLIISANNITLNLNGYTVTYDTSAQGAPAYGIEVTWNFSGVHITNGNVTQGAGNDYQSVAVYGQQANSWEVDHLTINYQGNDNEGIQDNCGSSATGVNIHDNTIYPNGTKQTLTHYGNFYVIDVTSCGGVVSVTNNNIQGKGYQGIGYGYGAPVTGTVEITGNTIEMAAPVVDGYAIDIGAHSNVEIGFEVAHNTIQQSSGRGIVVEGDLNADSPGPGTGTIHHNNITVQEACDSGEYGCPGTDIGIQLRFGAHNIQVYSNTITGYAGTSACPTQFASQVGSSCLSEGIKVIAGQYAVNNQVYSNTVTVSTTDTSYFAAGLYPDGTADGTSSFSSNNVTSNSYIVLTNGPDGGGSNFVLASNTFTKGSNPQAFHSIQVGYWTSSSTGNVFLDNTWVGGASVTDLGYAASGGAAYSLCLKYYLTVVVQYANSSPVAGATVTAASSQESVSGTTDSTGTVKLVLTDYLQSGTTYPGSASTTSYTPHTVTASMTGYTNATASVTMTSDQSITMQLGGFPISLTTVAH